MLPALVLLTAALAAEPTTPTAPPPVEVQAGVDKAVATTGDVITYTVRIEHDEGVTLEVPEPGAEIAGLRIIDTGEVEPIEHAGRVRSERWYKLRADLVGSYVLPALTVRFHRRPAEVESAGPTTAPATPGSPAAPAAPAAPAGPIAAGEPETVETSEIFLEVKSVLPQDGEVSDIRDVKPLIRTRHGPPLWVWVVSGVALAALAVAAVVWVRRRRKVVVTPLAPPHEVAFAALDALRRTDFADRASVMAYYYRISEVLRAYIEDCFTLNATDLTTEEILPRLAELAQLDNEKRLLLREFLTDTDQVKYAEHEPSAAEIEKAYEHALRFVEKTMPRPESAAAGGTR